MSRNSALASGVREKGSLRSRTAALEAGGKGEEGIAQRAKGALRLRSVPQGAGLEAIGEERRAQGAWVKAQGAGQMRVKAFPFLIRKP